MNNKTRKLLIPMGTLLLAAGVTFGSGATWSSEHSMTASVTGGHLVNVSDKDKTSVLSVDHLKPGVQKDGVITLTEDSSNDVDGTLKLVASNVSNTFDNYLLVRVTSSTGTHSTDSKWFPVTALGSATGGEVPLVDLSDGFGTATVTISVKLDENAPNSDQGKEVSADLKLVTTATTDNSTNTTVNWTAPVN